MYNVGLRWQPVTSITDMTNWAPNLSSICDDWPVQNFAVVTITVIVIIVWELLLSSALPLFPFSFIVLNVIVAKGRLLMFKVPFMP